MHRGCIELYFLIPCFIVDDIIFPLTTNQEAALEKEGVLQLQYRNYCL